MTSDTSILISLLASGSSKKSSDSVTDTGDPALADPTMPDFSEIMEDHLASDPALPNTEQPAEDEVEAALSEGEIEEGDRTERRSPLPFGAATQNGSDREAPRGWSVSENVRGVGRSDETSSKSSSKAQSGIGLKLGHELGPWRKEEVSSEIAPRSEAQVPDALPVLDAPERLDPPTAIPRQPVAEQRVPTVSVISSLGSAESESPSDTAPIISTAAAETETPGPASDIAKPVVPLAESSEVKPLQALQVSSVEQQQLSAAATPESSLEISVKTSSSLSETKAQTTFGAKGFGPPEPNTSLPVTTAVHPTQVETTVVRDISDVPAAGRGSAQSSAHSALQGRFPLNTPSAFASSGTSDIEPETFPTVSRAIAPSTTASVMAWALQGSTAAGTGAVQLNEQVISQHANQLFDDAVSELPLFTKTASQGPLSMGTVSGPGASGHMPILQPMQTSGAPGAISVQIAQSIENAKQSDITVRLDPQELGTVRLVLSTRKSGLHVAIYAERSETLELLRRESDDLASSLGDLGLEGHPSFQFERDEGGRFGSSENNQQSSDMPDMETGPNQIGMMTLQARPDGLDLRL